ncbi:MAG: hypothetical protein AB1925_12395 [Actinomycetota bacterium]
MMVWPWAKHRQEVAELTAKLEEDDRRVKAARTRTLEATLDQMASRQNSSVVMGHIRLNGWTEMLQAAWKGRP